MENVILALVCIAVLVTGAVTIASVSFNSIDTIVHAWKEEEYLSTNMRNTMIKSVSSNTTSEGTQTEIVIKNEGNTALANFSKWDVIVIYQNSSAQWLPYTTATPGWTIGGIFLNGQPEIYEPNIFNPWETMNLILKLSPAVAEEATNLAIISTPTGATTEINFGR